MSTELHEERLNTNIPNRMSLFAHLSELRARLIRVFIYVTIATCVCWFLYDSIYFVLTSPVKQFLGKNGSSFLLTGVTEGFNIKMQISLISGVILASPLISFEGWRFISPGLTRKERKAVYFVAPLAVFLFCSGLFLAYYILPVGIKWLIDQNPPGAKLMPSVQQTILFVVKMYLAFGILFQLPIVLMFLAKVGLVNSRMLKSQWRYAVVVISFLAAIITPSGDAMTMMMLATPMYLLYLMSILLVRLVGN